MGFVGISERNARGGGLIGSPDNLDAQRSWLIEVDDPSDDQFDVYGYTEVNTVLPSYLSFHPNNVFWTCRRVWLEPTSSRFHWIANAQYSAAPLSKDEQERASTPNPTARPLRLEVDSDEFERLADKDAEDNPLKNSAGDKYPAQAVEDSRTVLLLEKDVDDWDTDWLHLNNRFNDGELYLTDGVKAYTVGDMCGYLKRLRVSQRKEENGYSFYTISGQLHVKETADEWKLSLADEGFHYLASGTRKRVMVKDAAGRDVEPAEPQFLDGSGGVLAVAGTVVFNDFLMQKKADLIGLPFFTTPPP